MEMRGLHCITVLLSIEHWIKYCYCLQSVIYAEVPPCLNTLRVPPTRGGCFIAFSLVVERVHIARWNLSVDCPMASDCGGAQRTAGRQAGEISRYSPHECNKGNWFSIKRNFPDTTVFNAFIPLSPSYYYLSCLLYLSTCADHWPRFSQPWFPQQVWR